MIKSRAFAGPKLGTGGPPNNPNRGIGLLFHGRSARGMRQVADSGGLDDFTLGWPLEHLENRDAFSRTTGVRAFSWARSWADSDRYYLAVVEWPMDRA